MEQFTKDFFSNKKLLYVGENRGNSLSRYTHLKSFFKEAQIVSYTSIYTTLHGRILNKFSKHIIHFFCSTLVKKTFDEVNPDIVWIEMGREINHTVIEYMKSKGAFLVNTYSDSFTDTISNKVSIQYNKSIPFYDVIFTPRESDFQLYKQYGAKRLEKFWKGFDPALISDEKSQTLDVDFIFAGHMEADRKIDLEYVLADKDFNYKIYGDGWRTSRLANVYNSLPFDQYGKIYEATKIGINYLSKWANDTQNSRLFEIPASKTMLLCEYSNDAANCFRPGIEADFFSSKEELLEKLDFYISNPIITEKITINGYRRAKQLYSNNTRVEDMLTKIHAIYI